MTMVNTPEKLYQEREKRVLDAIALKKPDRVPVLAFFGSFPVEHAKIKYEEEANDPIKCLEANLKANIDFQPDMVVPSPTIAGSVLGPLDYKQIKWAGHGLSSDATYQAVELAPMKDDEYDELLYDPSDFIVRKYWARTYGSLNVLESLPPLRQNIGYFAAPFSFLPFGLPEGVKALNALKKAGEEAVAYVQAMMSHIQQLKKVGFPMFFIAGTEAPFDFIGDFLRGRKNVMLDMYRRPEKLIAATEKLLPMAIETGVAGAKMSGNPRVFIAVHGGIEAFMSVEQYKRFYWPTFRELLHGLVKEGCNPVVLVEGGSTSRLEFLKDVPAGKVCYIFEDVDLKKARVALGGSACIAGNVPMSLLATGDPDDVRAYCKMLIDTLGRDGGYIMSAGGSMDNAKVANIKAMIEFAKVYGTY
jgi:uroporphyrinogen-III decarboxylase